MKNTTTKKLQKTIAGTGLSGLALLIIGSVIIYFGFIASDRYATETQFVVKQSGSSEVAFAGLASFGSVSGSMQDALIIKEFILSREMAVALDSALDLRAHYQNDSIDWFSRLPEGASTEQFIQYFQERIEVHHDEMSDILYVEVQAFTPEFSLDMSRELLLISEQFINGLGDKMIREQLEYAQEAVTRANAVLQEEQKKLLDFQDANRLYSPEQEGGAILLAVNNLQAQIITEQAKLKNMLATMHESIPAVRTQKDLIRSLEAQLQEEKKKLTSPDTESFNKVTVEYGEIELEAALATDLYKSSLASLETIRAEAYQKLKHLLIIQYPALAEESKYPLRLYNIVTWTLATLVVYLLTILILAIVREHSE